MRQLPWVLLVSTALRTTAPARKQAIANHNQALRQSYILDKTTDLHPPSQSATPQVAAVTVPLLHAFQALLALPALYAGSESSNSMHAVEHSAPS